MDIRSFFSPKTKPAAEPQSSKKSEDKSNGSKRKRIQRIDSSDDEEDMENVVKPLVKPLSKSPAKSSKKPKEEASKSSLKPVNVDEFFGGKAEKKKKPQKEDTDLDAVLREMDDDFEVDPLDPPSKKMKLTQGPSKGGLPSNMEKKDSPQGKKTTKPTASESPSLAKKLSSLRNKKRSYEIEVEEAPTKIKDTPKKAASNVLNESDEIPGTPQDKFEEQKKKQQATYKQFLARGGARNPGCKDIPEIVPGALDKLVFVLTGVYDSLEREEMGDIIKKCGGKTTTSLSRNTTYIVVGDQPGEAKLKKAETLGTKRLDEDGLLDLIREKSKSVFPSGRTPIKSEKHDDDEGKRPKSDERRNNRTKVKSERGDERGRSKEPPSKRNAKVEVKVEEPSSPAKKSPATSTKAQPESNNGVKKTSSPKKGKSQPRSKEDYMLWVDKYKPLSLKSIIGQQGDRSNMRKLLEWLKNWSKYHGPAGPHKAKPPPRPSPWATAGDNGGWAKCALLSGPPGVGKTTTASLVCKELGFDVMELNASDGRSKKTLDNTVKEALSSASLSRSSSKRVLLMDEVDGMAGNEDRGGIAHLILLLKSSKIPVICMCNDRNHEKIRSLANHCFDLRFQRPRVEQIKAAMMSICFKEKIKVNPDALNELIGGCNNDVRQVLHHLSMLKARENSSLKSLTKDEAKAETRLCQKTSIKLGPWDVCKKVFSSQEHSSMSLFDKSDLFFYDFSIGPLFVQENYLSVTPEAAKKDKKKAMELISMAANSICEGDLVEKTIRSKNAWNLLPINAIYASVLPGEYMSGSLHGQIQFPSWLGKNSRKNKMSRILQELASHTRLRTGACKSSMGFDYAQHLESSITGPLRRSGAEGIPESIRVMEAYSLQREDLDSLIEYVSSWPGKEDPMKAVESKVKASFTRSYNKEVTALPYSTQVQSAAKRKTAASTESLSLEEEAEPESDHELDDIGSDAMIKAKTSKSKSSSKKKESESSKSSSSRSKKTKKK